MGKHFLLFSHPELPLIFIIFLPYITKEMKIIITNFLPDIILIIIIFLSFSGRVEKGQRGRERARRERGGDRDSSWDDVIAGQ